MVRLISAVHLYSRQDFVYKDVTKSWQAAKIASRSSLTNKKDHHYFLNRFVCVGEFRPILALNCRLQVEQINVVESAGGPLVLALGSLRFLSASQFLFSKNSLICTFHFLCYWAATFN